MGVTTLDFSDHPPPESQFLSDNPFAEFSPSGIVLSEKNLGLNQAIFSLFCLVLASSKPPTPYILVHLLHRFVLISGG